MYDRISIIYSLTLRLPWGAMHPKMKFDLALLRTDSKYDIQVTEIFLSLVDLQRDRVSQISDKPIWHKKIKKASYTMGFNGPQANS